MNAFQKFLLLIKVSRPVLWIGPVLPFFGGLVISGKALDMPLLAVIQLIIIAFPYNLLIYGINDIYDYESDIRNPRKGGAQGLKLKKENHPLVMRWSLVAAFAILLSSLTTLNLTNMIGAVIAVASSYFYSAPPLRLKVRPLMDSVTNGFIYVLGPAIMGFSFGGSLLEMPIKAYWIAIGVIGFHAFSTILDYSADKEAGDRTFAVVLGKRAAASFAFVILVAVFLFSGITSFVINTYLVIMSIITLVAVFYPSERYARIAFWSLFFLSLIGAAIFFTQS